MSPYKKFGRKVVKEEEFVDEYGKRIMGQENDMNKAAGFVD